MPRISLFIPRGFLPASSSPAAALSTVHMPPPLRSSFREGLPTLQENFDEFRGAHDPSLRPPRASGSFLLLQPPPNPSGSASGPGSRRQPGLGSQQGVHVARRPAGGTGGDRCHGGPDLFLQEECKELIVSLPGNRSLHGPATPRGKISWVCACQMAGGPLWDGRGGGPSAPVRQPRFYSGPPGLGNTASKNSTEAPHPFSLVDCWRKFHLGAPLSPAKPST